MYHRAMPVGSSVQVQYMSLTKHKETHVDTNSAVPTYTLLQQPNF